MKTLRVNLPGREYDIHIGAGLLSRAGELVRGLTNCKKLAIVTDSNVGPLYAEKLCEALKSADFETKVITVEAGEKSKSLSVLERLYGEMLDFGITRADMIVALGGGVVGDLTGFAASSLLRGIPFVQIPTTLLAQVDSSVGGKVAVNLPHGKNLVGAFYQPKKVIIDTECLRTLSPEILADGMAEVIKYGGISDKNLFEILENIKDTEELFAKIHEIVYTCCDIKRRVVEDDELDLGGRMILNFGHTFGHAIEKKYGYSGFTHGMAVAVGMVMACERGEKEGVTPAGTTDRMRKILENYSLPVSADISHDELAAAVGVDKKGAGSKINLILLKEIGEALIYPIAKTEI